MISRRSLFKGSLAMASASLLTKSAHAESASHFRFVHLTDIHIQPELGAIQGTHRAVNRIMRLDPLPDFVITGGDHIMDGITVQAERANLQFDLIKEALKPLEMPIHYVVGNHDCFGWSQTSAVSKRDPLYGKGMFQEKVVDGPTYRSFDFGGVRFIILDTIGTTFAGEWMLAASDPQLTWLKTLLGQTPHTMPIIVATHAPLLTSAHQIIHPRLGKENAKLLCYNGHEVRELWKNHNVKTVLQGHTHIIESVEYLGAHYVTGGAVSGDWWRGPRLGVHHEGFMVYDVSPEKVKYHYVKSGWKTLYDASNRPLVADHS